MNFTKSILLILFSFLSTINFAQNKSELDCENGFEKIETELKSQKTVSYKIVFSQRLFTNESSDFSEGLVVISDLNDLLNPQEIIETIARIGVKNKLSKIVAFRNCQAVEIYQQQNNIDNEQKEFLENNLIAKIDIDLNKTLTKKEKKRNKRKRELLESLSQESCENLKQLNSDNLSREQFEQVFKKIMLDNVKQIEKVYDKYLDELFDEFTEALIHQLNIDCQLVKELIEKS